MRAGDAVWNTLTGEKAVFVETAEETEGRRIVVDFAVEPGGFVPGGEHLHSTCSEHLEVRAGRITFDVGGEEREVGAGEEITVVPGTWHRWWNAGDDEVRIRARVEPAIRFQEAIVVFWGMCSDGLTNDEGQPSPLLGALVATRYSREIRYRRPPAAVQRVAFPPLAAVARLRGLDDMLDRYLDPATHPSAEAGLGRLPDRVMERS
jgi:mannose-6-phosphate isomerase-like protein (cupin superfamily)